jgi:hypothetical protein
MLKETCWLLTPKVSDMAGKPVARMGHRAAQRKLLKPAVKRRISRRHAGQLNGSLGESLV